MNATEAHARAILATACQNHNMFIRAQRVSSGEDMDTFDQIAIDAMMAFAEYAAQTSDRAMVLEEAAREYIERSTHLPDCHTLNTSWCGTPPVACDCGYAAIRQLSSSPEAS